MIKKKYAYLKSFDLNCILYTNHFSLNYLNFNFHLFSELQVFKKQGKGQSHYNSIKKIILIFYYNSREL